MNKTTTSSARTFGICGVVICVVGGVIAGGCTLLLPTSELIQSCVAQDECADGFVCEDRACLPEDDDEGSGASG